MQTNIIKMVGPADIASILNALSGIFAVIVACHNQLYLSAVLLIMAVLFDAIDGPIARKYPSQTDEVFGETIDSLADIVSFGVSPALVLIFSYNTPIIYIPAILTICCGILRLSRYNTIITYQEGPTKTFIGLPIPVSSFTLAVLLLAQITNPFIITIIMSIIAVLMISSFKYKKIKNKEIFITVPILLLISLITPINIMLLNIPSYIILILILIYLISPIFVKE